VPRPAAPVSPAATETLSAGCGAARTPIEGSRFVLPVPTPPGMRLLLLAAVALFGGDHGTQSITGTIVANSGTSLTVASPDRSLTCAVTYVNGQAALLKWGTGVRVGMGCKKADGRLVLVRLARLGQTEPPKPLPPTTTTTTTTEPPPAPQPKQAIGVVTALSSSAVTVGDLTCAITPAPDSTAAAAKLSLGATVGIVCRPDGGRFVLSGATIVQTTVPPVTKPAVRTAIGEVSQLSSTSVTVGELTCAITGAADSQGAAAKLVAGKRFGIVCRADGDHWVLSGSTPAS